MSVLFVQGGRNDLEGEFSVQEFRWAQMQAAAKGVPPQQLSAELGILKAAQDRQWQVSTHKTLSFLPLSPNSDRRTCLLLSKYF